MPENNEEQKKQSLPIGVVRKVKGLCKKQDDDLSWLIALLSDTGMRLGEGVGLLKSDINLNSNMPHINLVLHLWRRSKTIRNI